MYVKKVHQFLSIIETEAHKYGVPFFLPHNAEDISKTKYILGHDFWGKNSS